MEMRQPVSKSPFFPLKRRGSDTSQEPMEGFTKRQKKCRGVCAQRNVLMRGERRRIKHSWWKTRTGCDPLVTNDTDFFCSSLLLIFPFFFFFNFYFGGWKHKKNMGISWVHVLNSTKPAKPYTVWVNQSWRNLSFRAVTPIVYTKREAHPEITTKRSL